MVFPAGMELMVNPASKVPLDHKVHLDNQVLQGTLFGLVILQL